MKIKRFNESNSDDKYQDIKDILIDLNDLGFEIENITNGFSSTDFSFSENDDDKYKFPSLRLKLINKNVDLDISYISDVLECLYEVNDRLSENYDPKLREFNFRLGYPNSISYILNLKDKEELPINHDDNYYNFLRNVRRQFNNNRNVTTKSFDIKHDNRSIILVPKNDIKASSFLSRIKNFINSKFETMGYNNGLFFNYSIYLKDDKIYIDYLGLRQHRYQPLG